MTTFLIAVLAFFGFIVAYNTYGRWLATRIFDLDPERVVPSQELQDDIDFVPSKKSVVFGHHFTSIAGTGPIVGPAIAVFWGWLPALLWVVFGSIFIGAVHDFGALVVSLRNRGQSVGQIAGRLISPRTKILFLLVLFFALTIVLAIFGLVIAAIFKIYPESVLPVWISLPIAIVVGILVRKRNVSLLPLSIVALVIIYSSVYLGTYVCPIELALPAFEETHPLASFMNPTVVWTIVLLTYCAVASILPVWLLLQPRDYINSYQLIVALVLLMAGLLLATLSGQANLFSSAPPVVQTDQLPLGTPPIWPFLFITIACGAISGFHCLVSSGTSSKQIANERDSLPIGYGAMLLEGALATIVILACCAGIGMGVISRTTGDDGGKTLSWKTDGAGQVIRGEAAWNQYYSAEHWDDFKLGRKVGAFVDGGANFLTTIGMPLKLAVAMIAVLVACFAATTLDTATRLQRYVIQELGSSLRIRPLQNIYVATGLAVFLGGLIALLPGPDGSRGSGGLLLWPLFGATNQLLAGLAFLVTAFYLWRRNKPVWFIVIPMIIMIILPAWALIWQLFSTELNPKTHTAFGWIWSFSEKPLLPSIAMITLALQLWMVFEAVVMWPTAKGVLEIEPPPLEKRASMRNGGRSC